MIIKINRQDCLNRYKTFPLRSNDYKKEEEQFFYPNVFKNYILILDSRTFKGHVKLLGEELTKLIKAFQSDSLIFLGDTETPWLSQSNEYNPVKKAHDYLTNKKIGRRFNGGLQVDSSELSTFTKHLAWLTRCNAALPYFHFIDETESLVGSICKYGNLHLDTLNEESDKFLTAFVPGSKFEYGTQKSCHNWFGSSSAISGRQKMV